MLVLIYALHTFMYNTDTQAIAYTAISDDKIDKKIWCFQ